MTTVDPGAVEPVNLKLPLAPRYAPVPPLNRPCETSLSPPFDSTVAVPVKVSLKDPRATKSTSVLLNVNVVAVPYS